jgi:hypothetical protein
MADASGLSALAAGSVEVPLPDAPRNIQIGEDSYGYKYELWTGRVWRGVRAAPRFPKTGLADVLWLIRVETPGSDGFAWFAVHAPSDVATLPDLFANNRFVYASKTDQVLLPGPHNWFWFNYEANMWEPFAYTFDTKLLSSDEADNLASAT